MNFHLFIFQQGKSHDQDSPQCLPLQGSEETRKFYEDFLGLELAGALEITPPRREANQGPSHILQDGRRFLSGFFDDPETPFEFKEQRDFDLILPLKWNRTT